LYDEFSGACSWALSALCGVFVLEHFQHYVVNSPWQFWYCVPLALCSKFSGICPWALS
ncbi:5739_t:CDS:2, partial [Dentiscutata heterogama]